eukprot:CAMPEP_0172835472 /NCGR_PEP_ID=MMETSP1075-20121228/25795_1 /TAXON_ID=2916 /ORGANISM="Ceratium fusus, Strain PA161109" /LENGTH=126 /DNA_ID=CAMNT_0013678529 /DNA_START=67 /DNA_END=444 /DNA_ORIENTATION=-
MNPWWEVVVFHGLEDKISPEAIRHAAAGPVNFRRYHPTGVLLPLALLTDVADTHVFVTNALAASDIEDIFMHPSDTKKYPRAVGTPGDTHGIEFFVLADAHCTVPWGTWLAQRSETCHVVPRSKAT